ncbi:MAG: hypothetical protein LQ344_006796 [Seirophora lacunosa]|nr:MAG: hypothetical protein LQ344_006796 [Seirophora lacunosa]
MPDASNDKLQTCISFIVQQLQLRDLHSNSKGSSPFFLGINGVQGIGKTSLVSAIADLLEEAPYNLHTVVLSIDDFYLAHQDQLNLATTQRNNPLMQHRGQPSTHDLDLAASVLSSLQARSDVQIPIYDKSAFNGQGDRVPKEKWVKISGGQDRSIDLVILEGWCLGFRALDDANLAACWKQAVETREYNQEYRGRLGYNRLEDLRFVNEALREYDVITNQLDALIHLDAEDPQYVYEWRLEQEASLRRSKGSGMTDQEVVNFVNGYYPSYELFSDRLRTGALKEREGNQLRLVIGKERDVKAVLQRLLVDKKSFGLEADAEFEMCRSL